jgi:superfamily I DNA/RNA helicase
LAILAAILRASTVEGVNSDTSHGNSHTDNNSGCNIDTETPTLLYWAEMMKIEDIAAEIGDRFDHVLVDEYQDTNRLQSKILLRLKPDGRGVMVVGDDAQSVYSFRAATVPQHSHFSRQL